MLKVAVVDAESPFLSNPTPVTAMLAPSVLIVTGEVQDCIPEPLVSVHEKVIVAGDLHHPLAPGTAQLTVEVIVGFVAVGGVG